MEIFGNMDLAIINMISDLKFYYNLMYYLINTQMNNNLKIILTTDIVRYASMVNFEVNKFFKKEYNHEIVPLDIVNLIKNIRNQTKLYDKNKTDKQISNILNDIHKQYSASRDISLFKNKKEVIGSNLIIYHMLVRQANISEMKGEDFKDISAKVSSLTRILIEAFEKYIKISLDTNLNFFKPDKNFKIVFEDNSINKLTKKNNINEVELYKRLMILNEIFIIRFWNLHIDFSNIDYCSFYSYSKMISIKYREIIRDLETLNLHHDEGKMFEKIRKFRNTNHYSKKDGTISNCNINEISNKWCEQLDMEKFDDILEINNYIIKQIYNINNVVKIVY